MVLGGICGIWGVFRNLEVFVIYVYVVLSFWLEVFIIMLNFIVYIVWNFMNFIYFLYRVGENMCV